MADTRIEIETDQRGLSGVEIQELSKQEMEGVMGGYIETNRDLQFYADKVKAF